MVALKPWQDQLLLGVGQLIQKYGFQLQPGEQSFFRNTPFGRLTFHLSFIRHTNDFDVTADVAVRFDQVEEMVNRDREFFSKSKKMKTHTLGCELGNLSEGRQRRWTVASAGDVGGVASSIADAFEAIALPYLEKFSDEKRALEILSGDDKVSWAHSPFHEPRAKRAVSLALLINGEEAAREMARSKLSFLKSINDHGLSSFHAWLHAIGIPTDE